MFGFEKTNSAHQIDLMLRQMVGPDAADSFWSRFKDSYVTRDDIRCCPHGRPVCITLTKKQLEKQFKRT